MAREVSETLALAKRNASSELKRRRCLVCRHPLRREIEVEVLKGRSVRGIASQFGLPYLSLWKHKRDHLPATLVESDSAWRQERKRSWIRDVKALLDGALKIVNDPETTGAKHARLRLAAMRTALSILGLEGRALGEIAEAQVNVWTLAGFESEEHARRDREERESIKSMPPAEIHSRFMEFERRYAIETPGALADFETLVSLARRALPSQGAEESRELARDPGTGERPPHSAPHADETRDPSSISVPGSPAALWDGHRGPDHESLDVTAVPIFSQAQVEVFSGEVVEPQGGSDYDAQANAEGAPGRDEA